MKRVPLMITCLLILGAIAAVATVPLPAYVYAPAVIHPRGASSVYVEVPAVLQEVLVEPGQSVKEGDVLARLRNLDLEVEVTRLEGEVKRHTVQIKALEELDRSYADESARSRLAEVREQLESAEKELANKREDEDRLTLRAKIDGVVMPPDYRQDRRQDSKELGVWEGTPLSERNLGATLDIGDRFCRIGDPTKLEARLALAQDDIEFVLEGQSARIMLNQTTDLIYPSKITSISREEMPETPTRLSSLTGGSVATETDPSGAAKPLAPAFEAIVPLGDYDRLPDQAKQQHELLRVGLVGEAKITIEPRTLWQRFYRYLSRTINFDL